MRLFVDVMSPSALKTALFGGRSTESPVLTTVEESQLRSHFVGTRHNPSIGYRHGGMHGSPGHGNDKLHTPSSFQLYIFGME